MSNYVIRKKVNKTSGKEEIRYYGVPVSRGQVGLEQLANEISEMSSLTPGDVYAAVSSLSRMIQRYLKSGNTVYIKDIGHFSVSATSDGFETPEECTPAKVKPQRVCFRADNELRGVLEDMKYHLLKEK